MIFNRTLEDVSIAKSLIETKVKKFISLTSEELDSIERGTLTINTLNRIESAQKELKEIFILFGYYGAHIESKEWEHENVFYKKDLQRIILNCDTLQKAFFKKQNTPIAPSPTYDIYCINDIEKIISDLYDMVNEVRSLWAECGDAESGE